MNSLSHSYPDVDLGQALIKGRSISKQRCLNAVFDSDGPNIIIGKKVEKNIDYDREDV
jgi:hypothetical protein